MAGFSNIKDIVDTYEEGRVRYVTWRKSPTQTTTQGIWFDLSMSPGNPVPQYYASAPLAAVQMAQSTDGGLFHGAAVSPSSMYLRNMMAMTATATALPMPMILMDYLLYYPFIDEGTTDPQTLVNTNTLPRYTDGAGVQIMAVSVAARTGGQSFSVSYTNQDGVSGRTSGTVVQNTSTATGQLVTTATTGTGGACTGPFLPLQGKDTGVRSIQSVTMNGTDVGLFTLVLVKPLMEFQIRGNDAPVEVDPFLYKARMVEIKDDAYLNFICLPNGALNATAIFGDMTVAWK